jgi:hypothetical protein
MNNMPQAIALLVCALATVAARGAELSLSDFEAPGQWSGLELSSEQVKQGSRSGNWSHMDQTPTIRLASCPRDWTT